MADQDKSITELMELMKRDSDEFLNKIPRKPDVTIGSSGKRYYTDPEDRPSHEDIACAAEARYDSDREESLRESFPDQGHKLTDGSYNEGDGTITSPADKHLTEWDES